MTGGDITIQTPQPAPSSPLATTTPLLRTRNVCRNVASSSSALSIQVLVHFELLSHCHSSTESTTELSFWIAFSREHYGLQHDPQGLPHPSAPIHHMSTFTWSLSLVDCGSWFAPYINSSFCVCACQAFAADMSVFGSCLCFLFSLWLFVYGCFNKYILYLHPPLHPFHYSHANGLQKNQPL